MKTSFFVLLFFHLCFEAWYNYNAIQLREKYQKLQIITVPNHFNKSPTEFNEQGPYLIASPLACEQYAEVSDIITQKDKLLAGVLMVSIYQKVKSRIAPSTPNERTVKYEYVDKWVTKCVEWEGDDVNPNYKKWPLTFKSKLAVAKHFTLKGKKLDNNQLHKEMTSSKTRFTYTKIDFKAPNSLLNKQVIKVSKGYYFYGNDAESPQLGDVSLELKGLPSEKYHLGNDSILEPCNYTLLGEYDGENTFHPFYINSMNKTTYLFKKGGYINKEKIDNQIIGSGSNFYIWVARIFIFTYLLVFLFKLFNTNAKNDS